MSGHPLKRRRLTPEGHALTGSMAVARWVAVAAGWVAAVTRWIAAVTRWIAAGTRWIAAGAGWVAAVAATATAAAVTGCAPHPAAAPPIRIASAYVMQSNGANALAAYFVIANSGPADRLLSVRSSAGGQVIMVGPATRGPSATSAVSALTVAGHSLTRLDPSGYHLEILHSGRLHQGTDVTLTLVFAHAGTMRVPAQVNNPANNNGGYFGP